MSRFEWYSAFVLLVSLSSCSLVLDSEKVQCRRGHDEDCVDFSDKLLVCVDGACVETDEGQCTKSSACNVEDGELCNLQTKLCDPAAACKDDPDCAKTFEGAEKYICESGSCRAPDCEAPADCTPLGADFECVLGRCEDTKWGCIDKPDEREGVDGEGTYRVQILYVNVAGDQSPVQNLEARLCITVDDDCAVNSGSGQDYDEKTGWLTIKGLRKQKYILRLAGESPEDGTPLLNSRSYLYRPVIGNVKEPKPLLMFTAATRNLFEVPLMVATNWEDTGLLIARAYDCRDEPAKGVIFSTAPEDVISCPNMKPDCQTQPFYFNEDNVPSVATGSTDNYGVGGILNLRTDERTTISFVREATDDKYAEIEVLALPGEVTYTAIYPGKQ